MAKKIFPFDIKKWDFKKRRNKLDSRNETTYVNWIIATLKQISLEQYGTDKLSENQTWNALCIYMNKNNIEYLHKHLDPMVWLNYSPREDNLLVDNQFAVDVDNLTENQLL